MSRDKLESLMQDAGIVRNRAKIAGTVASARLYLEIEARAGLFQLSLGFRRRAADRRTCSAPWTRFRP